MSARRRGVIRAVAIAAIIIAMLLLLVVMAVWMRPQPQPTPRVPSPERITERPPVGPDENAIRAHNRAVGMMGRYEYDDAREIFAQLAEAHPDWHDVKVNFAIATLNRQRSGDEEAALAILKDVLEAEPEHVRARYVSGLLQLYRGDHEKAMEHLSFVAEHDPEDAFAAYFLAQAHVAHGDHEQALDLYDRAISRNPYLRSALYGKSRALIAIGREEASHEAFEAFQRLEPNPQAQSAEFVYTRMGPKAEAQAVRRAERRPSPPRGEVFADAVVMLGRDAEDLQWHLPLDRPASITIADITGNGELDIFLADAVRGENGAMNAVLVQEGGQFYLQLDHPLAFSAGVNAALWGDIDNNGLMDVYFCKRGRNELWKQTAEGEWHEVASEMGVAGLWNDTVGGLMFDADHDGDLDIFIVNTDGPNELFSNNLDGTFRRLGESQGISGGDRASRQVIAVDLQNDRDHDLIIIHDEPPHEVYLNDRLWQYTRAGEGSAFAQFVNADIIAAVAGDVRADGRSELFTIGSDSVVRRWERGENGVYQPSILVELIATDPAVQLALADVTGDTAKELLITSAEIWLAISLRDANAGEEVHRASDVLVGGWAVANLDAWRGPSVVGLPSRSRTGPVLWAPGDGRYGYAAVTFSGRDDPGHALRSNASGIGTRYAARMGLHWVAGTTLPLHSGPGQSLQPTPIGLAGHSQIDFISIDWSDGVFQTEIDLAAGELHAITETQRQLASCPVLFGWDGEKYEFASDVLGVGGIGFAIGPGEYAQPRPWERYLFPEGLLQPSDDGRYIIKIAEPMEEALYLDSAALIAHDLPPGWSMTVDERMGISGPQPTGETIFYQQSLLPTRAWNDRGEDMTEIVREQDFRAAPPGELDLRFLGRLAKEHVLTIAFDTPIDSLGDRPYLVADGWIEYPYSQTSFAAWQAGADYRAPTLEVRDPVTDVWHTVLEQFGYPAGFARQMALPLPIADMPAGAQEIRLRTNQEIYLDRVMIVSAEQPPAEHVRHELELVAAEVRRSGFAQRVLHEQRWAYYDYNNRQPLWDTRHQTGFYSEFGCALDLVRATDNALAIIGPGEEIHMEFAPPNANSDAESDDRREKDSDGSTTTDRITTQLPPLPTNWTRRFIIDLRGWCKDMDLYTKSGETLEPLPGADSPVREHLHRRYNTRYRSGR